MEIIDKNGNTIPNQESKRVLAGVLAILIGPLGIHKFVLGYTTQGLVLLGVSLLTCGIGVFITSIISLIEGIIYLSKSDEAFIHTYQLKKTAWFLKKYDDENIFKLSNRSFNTSFFNRHVPTIRN